MPPDFEQVRILIDQYSTENSPPLVVLGWGYPAASDDGRSLEILQARYLVRAFLTSLWQGVPLFMWFNLRDPSDAVETVQYGILRHDGGPRLAFTAAHTMNSALKGMTLLGRSEMESPNDFLLEFETNGRTVYAGWTAMSEAHEVTLPLMGGAGSIIDIYGSETGASWDSRDLAITLTPDPVFIRLHQQ